MERIFKNGKTILCEEFFSDIIPRQTDYAVFKNRTIERNEIGGDLSEL